MNKIIPKKGLVRYFKGSLCAFQEDFIYNIFKNFDKKFNSKKTKDQ